MLYLIKKEFTANVRYILTGFVIFLLYAFIFSRNGDTLFALCLTFCFYSIANTNLVMDERYKIDRLLLTLPIRRKDIVLSKHLMVIIVFAVCFAAFTFLVFLGRTIGYDKIAMLSFNTAMIGFFSISLLNAVTLPLSYKFGAQATRYVSLFICLAMFFLSSLPVFKNVGVFRIMVGLPNLVPIGTIMLVCSVLLNIISYIVSYSIYKKKDF